MFSDDRMVAPVEVLQPSTLPEELQQQIEKFVFLYKQKNMPILPMNPGEMYEDYTNWHKEFNIEEEIVW